jgi:hypothetical protein
VIRIEQISAITRVKVGASKPRQLCIFQLLRLGDISRVKVLKQRQIQAERCNSACHEVYVGAKNVINKELLTLTKRKLARRPRLSQSE